MNNQLLQGTEYENIMKPIQATNSDSGFSSSPSLASTEPPNNEKFTDRKRLSERFLCRDSTREKRFSEKSISEKSICMGTKESISAASSYADLPLCGQSYAHKLHKTQNVHKMHSAHKDYCSSVHITRGPSVHPDCGMGPYVHRVKNSLEEHKVNSSHEEGLLCVYKSPNNDSCGEVWREERIIGEEFANNFGQRHPQSLAKVDKSGDACETDFGGEHENRNCEEYGKSGKFPAASSLFPIYTNVRRLQLPLHQGR